VTPTATTAMTAALAAMDEVVAEAQRKREAAQAEVDRVHAMLREADEEVRRAERSRKVLLGEPLTNGAPKRVGAVPRSQGAAADLSRLVSPSIKGEVRKYIEKQGVKGVVLQQDITEALDTNSGNVSLSCRALAAEGLVRQVKPPSGSKPNAKAWQWVGDGTAAALNGKG
jgi:hypothetical protein